MRHAIEPRDAKNKILGKTLAKNIGKNISSKSILKNLLTVLKNLRQMQ